MYSKYIISNKRVLVVIRVITILLIFSFLGHNTINCFSAGNYSIIKTEKIDEESSLSDMEQDKNTEAYRRHVSRGDSLEKLGKYDEAMIEFQRASDLMPLEEYPRLKMQAIETSQPASCAPSFAWLRT